MKLKVKLLPLLLVIISIVLTACSNDAVTKKATDNDDKAVLKTITSFTIIEDMVKEIGGEHVDIHNLVPTGTDPHEYEPKPEDIKAVSDADILFYNGLNLEGSDTGWLSKLTDSVGMEEDQLIEVGRDVEPMYLKDEDNKKEINPHSFINPKIGISMAEIIRDTLIDIDPDNKSYYEDNAKEYLDNLEDIEQRYAEEFASIPKEDRVLVASEFAFQYLADEYDINPGYIWAIDTDDNGSPEQIKNAVEFVKKYQPKHLFVESNVDTRPMETVSKESGVPIYEHPLFSDEIGSKDEKADTYVKYLETNLKHMIDGLK